jgi:hypothetical protein
MIIERGRNIPADSNKKAPGSAGIRDRDRPVVIGLPSHFDLVSSAAVQATRGPKPHRLQFKPNQAECP